MPKWDVRLLSVEHNGGAQAALLDRLMFEHGYERRYPGYSLIEAWYRNAIAASNLDRTRFAWSRLLRQALIEYLPPAYNPARTIRGLVPVQERLAQVLQV